MIERNLRGGVRNGNGALSGGAGWLRSSDREDLQAYLLEVGWEAAERFRPAAGRLAGYVVWILHRRVTDFLRERYGSTRYGPKPELIPFDPRYHDGSTIDEYPSEQNSRQLDRDGLSATALEGVALFELAIETDRSAYVIARELEVPVSSIDALRREAVVRD